MEYMSAAQAAKVWNVSERSVRNYCAQGRVPGAFLTGKTWSIPETAAKPVRRNRHVAGPETLLDILKAEMAAKTTGGIYHRVQIELTYNSNHMEGSRLTHDQTRYIYETNTVGGSGEALNVDDIVETANHFRCIDMVIGHAADKLSERFIKTLHATLKSGTGDARKNWFAVGEYKRLPNEVGGRETTAPENVADEMKKLLQSYERTPKKTLDTLLAFHYRLEAIHPFQDGNGRIGRLLLFKECLKNGIVPFIIDDESKLYYYRGLRQWPGEKGYLTDTCLAAQDRFKAVLDYFRIPY